MSLKLNERGVLRVPCAGTIKQERETTEPRDGHDARVRGGGGLYFKIYSMLYPLPGGQDSSQHTCSSTSSPMRAGETPLSGSQILNASYIIF